jgi:4-aminobutyrate aminotransferase-like enzyme
MGYGCGVGFLWDSNMMNAGRTLELLRAYESRNVTFIEEDGSWPIVWERANGVHVWDVEGKKYLDLTAAFGVAATGHANPRVVRAGQRQMGRLLHAMGDVHPHVLKARLARELSRITFGRWVDKSKVQSPKSKVNRRLAAAGTGKTIFCNSGYEAVEVALKTAMLATGKAGVIAFEGAYHGVGYGALNVTQREHFRGPFRGQLREFGCFVPFPESGQAWRCSNPVGAGMFLSAARRSGVRGKGGVGDGECSRVAADKNVRAPGMTGYSSPIESELGECGLADARALKAVELQMRRVLRRGRIGAILVEPIQVRGGINIPPLHFLPMLRRLCDEYQALLILDEIYAGFGRTGKWFACEHSGTVPDIICLGKALTGGFPLSVCVGRADVMDAAWPPSSGEAIHTSTFLGHPVGCAMALAQIKELEDRRLVQRSAGLGEFLLAALADFKPRTAHLAWGSRGVGLLVGVEVCLPDGSPATRAALRIVKALLHRGLILLPEGEHSNVIGFTPPLTISQSQLREAVNALGEELHGYRVK